VTFDPRVLKVLRCPETGGELTLVDLPAALEKILIEKHREHFRDELPVVKQGLLCADAQLVYPIVSDIALLLKEEALAAQLLETAPTAS
jgi:uncharacterized protein YbaR (Trm112 family)